jgi:hypothetical protein
MRGDKKRAHGTPNNQLWHPQQNMRDIWAKFLPYSIPNTLLHQNYFFFIFSPGRDGLRPESQVVMPELTPALTNAQRTPMRHFLPH